jgi:hypothetical protein
VCVEHTMHACMQLNVEPYSERVGVTPPPNSMKLGTNKRVCGTTYYTKSMLNENIHVILNLFPKMIWLLIQML